MSNKKQPEIRLPEFTNEWRNLELGEVLKVNSGRDYKHLQIGDIPVYGTGGYMLSVNDRLSDVNAIGIGRKGTINKPQLLEAPFWTVDTLFYMTPKGSNDLYFNYILAQKINWKMYDESTGVPSLSKASIEKIPFKIPSIEEQQKIGKIFKNMDEIINLQQQELTTLKQTKQGFLQKMFPKEGESVPELRFPGFTEDWKASNLIDMTTLITKGTTPKDKYSKGNVNFIKVENIEAYSGVVSVTSKVSQEEHEGYLKRSQLKCGDILFSIAGTLGRTTVIKEEILPANTNQALAIIRLVNGNIDFIETYLKGKAVKDYIRKNPTVGAQPNLSLRQVGELSISYPSDLEQKKIGEFFKNLDRTIALKQQELDALKQTKKAFLQKMFV